MQKIIYIIIIFFLIFSPTYALVVEDLSDQITEQTGAVNKNLAETKAELGRLQINFDELKARLTTYEEKAIWKTDLPELYSTVEYVVAKGLQNQLLMLLMIVVFSFSAFFLFKSRKWI